jgi:hypothetical protein
MTSLIQKFLLALFFLFLIFSTSFAQEENKDLKDIQFESLLIQGQVQRPDLAIVTGDPGDNLEGLLRMRTDFTDLMAQDAGEEIK